MRNQDSIKGRLAVRGTAELSAFPINYSWTDVDGIRCSGHTVSIGRDRAQAERRFFRSHQHTMQEGGAR